MGLLGMLKKGLSRSVPTIAEIASGERVKQEEAYNAWVEEAERQHRLIQEKTRPPFIDSPCGPFGFYPFPAGQYVCLASLRYDSKTGEVYEDSRSYYANRVAVELFLNDLCYAESLLDGSKLGLPSLPALRTDAARFVALDDLVGRIPPNTISMSIAPLTPTGKKPRYISSARFSSYLIPDYDDPNCYRGFGEKGSGGTFWYLENGSIGKAEIDYWDGTVHFRVKFKTVAGNLVVSNISYSDTIGVDPIAIYRS
ncbi:hypothetical protein [Adlercreutzia equolifaciens]|uniref:hypothetical protein n=1 Tax=Adlercreutzia equolifaciens TaxID=446660 RepID=UPI002671CC81|nr:hypothetical protein [Adlercreutzia equolifaciens]